MACQKVCKQGRDDIIVKVNLTNGKNDAGMRLCKFTFTIISSLPFLCFLSFYL